jgi:hypothetical protein
MIIQIQAKKDVSCKKIIYSFNDLTKNIKNAKNKNYLINEIKDKISKHNIPIETIKKHNYQIINELETFLNDNFFTCVSMRFLKDVFCIY